jgi:hypothetical protein
MLTADKEARFWAKVEIGPGCWNWTGAMNPSGYGRFAAEGRTLHGAHRVAFQLNGGAIPEGMVIDHICRNRRCVNPAHLRCVDRLTNVHENSEASAHLNSIKSHCASGHPLSGANLFVRADGYRGCRQCRRAYHRAKRALVSGAVAKPIAQRRDND